MFTKFKDKSAQMTVEMCIVFPIMIVVAVIITNALSFASECAAFDRCSRNFVRVEATSPKISSTASEIKNAVLVSLREQFDKNNESVVVDTESVDASLTRCVCQLAWSPTLFGLGLKESVFGISIPHITHKCELVVDTYKPGDLI